MDELLFDFPAKTVGLSRLRGRTFALMTDIHFEGEGSVTVDSDVLSRAITTINLSNADAVFMLGDYVQKDARHATALLHNYLQKLTLTVSSQTNTS